jgi:prepilin-type N-terminal cleavage/methylation domain-containing protein
MINFVGMGVAWFYFEMRLKSHSVGLAGFTLVEIMIVILILAMLLAIVVPYYVKQRATAQANGCINNLIKIEAAANEFALECGKKTGDPINYPTDLIAYIKPQAGHIPPCPAGGVYQIASVGGYPTCSLGTTVTPNHVIP